MDVSSKDTIAGYWEDSSMGTQEKEKCIWKLPSGTDSYASLFSTSLPVIRHGKANFSKSDLTNQFRDDSFPGLGRLHIDDESKDPPEETDPNIGINDSFLPGDEDELLAGLMDDFDLSGLPTQLEDIDDDIFGSGGGLEIDPMTQDNLVYTASRLSTSDGISGTSTAQYGFVNGVGTVSGEHPYGEHPSRTLFVRNINSNVEESELRSLFEQYGDIRTLYTACKHRGFVMISYYDIRAARNAMRALQGKPLRRRKLDIHFSIPKDNPSEKDINQGTLVVFNLDPSVSNDDLHLIFGAYGQVKEIRETPHKRHHKFIEFYDVRAADMALKALNRSEIAGKRIKLEHSRPGGARRSFMQQLTQDPELDEARAFQHQVGSPINSPPGSWPSFGSPLEHHSMRSYNQTPPNHSPVGINQLPGLASILSSQKSNAVKISPIGKESGKLSHVTTMTNTSQGMAFLNHFSVPEHNLSSSPGPASPFADPKPNSVGTLSGPEFLWGSPKVLSEQQNSSSLAWSASLKGPQVQPSGQGIGFPYATRHGPFLGPNHHVGSAPSVIKMDRHVGFYPKSPDTSSINHSTYGVTDFSHSNVSRVMNMGGSPGGVNIGAASFSGSSSPSPRMMSMPSHGPIYFGNGTFGSVGNDYFGMMERARSKRMDSGVQVDNKKLYQLDLEKIRNGEDNRTTLMIKNIPNKYTSKMLLIAIDETHKGTYDFLYLPIDFKNKCNVGYAFINMVSPLHIITFYEVFNGKKWEKFNSEKVASLAYARIQGKSSLVSHFQNSSLMNEDKRCRPILFRPEGQDSSDLEHSGNLNILICQPDGSYAGEDSLDSPKSDPSDMQ